MMCEKVINIRRGTTRRPARMEGLVGSVWPLRNSPGDHDSNDHDDCTRVQSSAIFGYASRQTNDKAQQRSCGVDRPPLSPIRAHSRTHGLTREKVYMNSRELMKTF